MVADSREESVAVHSWTCGVVDSDCPNIGLRDDRSESKMELNRWVGFPIPTAPGPNTTADTSVDFPPLGTKNGDKN